MATPTSYITVVEFGDLGPVPEAFRMISDGVKLAHGAVASRMVDSYFRDRFVLPLLSWGDDVKGATAALMAQSLMTHRGYNPVAGADVAIKEARDFWKAWLVDVAEGRAIPTVVDSAPGATEGVSLLGGLRITTTTRRGW